MSVTKRTGEVEVFKRSKVEDAIAKAMLETEEGVDNALLQIITESIEILASENDELSVEEIQDEIEVHLMQSDRPDVARRYVIYRNERAQERSKGWTMTELQKSIWKKKYNHDELETFDKFLDRVSNENPRVRKMIQKKQFLFAGRILSNRGLQNLGYKVTYSNCYVLPKPSDNIESIWDTARDMARTYSYGGGVGIDISELRPENAKVHNNARSTSGAPSFMPLYSKTTETIGQKGRRGALMISIRSSHPDLEQFIDIKALTKDVQKANVSVRIDNEFMIAVREDKEYRLHFTVEDTGEVIEKMVSAKKMYEKIIVNNLDWAEPGALFWDRINTWHFMSNHPDFEYHGVNPCAEEPLPPGGSCLLASINLAEFVIAPFTDRAMFDVNKYKEVVRYVVFALNEVLDEGLPLHPLEVQRITVRALRQIGLGVMGIADMLVKLGITYGSTKSLALCEMIAQIQLNEAVLASADYAKENGVYEWYDWNYLSESPFFQQLPPDTKAYVQQHGMANSQLLCIAPTGSISTMLGISGGIEPFFSLSYNRRTQSLHGEDVVYKVEEPIVQQYRDATGNMGELPEYFITSHDLDWKSRIEMQAVWQRYIDASISSTINLHRDTTADQAMDLYMYAWEMGLKGCTIYRDGCKLEGILTLDDTPNTEEGRNETEEEVEYAKGYYSECPDCKSKEMVVSNGCVTCKNCGFSPC